MRSNVIAARTLSVLQRTAAKFFFVLPEAFVPLWQKNRYSKKHIYALFGRNKSRRFPFVLVLFLALSSCADFTTGNPPDSAIVSLDSAAIIPQPVLLEKRQGSFKLSEETQLTYSEDLFNEGNYLATLIDSAVTFKIKKIKNQQVSESEIELKLVNDFPEELQHGEAYRLIIAPDKLQITALTQTGIMRGIQTVRQLFIPAFHSDEKRAEWYLPCLKIEDKPAFEHRGLMLDVCRHFFEKEVVFKYIDALAFYKMNVLHFHLTDDQGWRIAIDKYPLLNKISSFRTEKDGSIYGGSYTKDELKEIVAYAAERHIVVIPEIELPGHAQAVLAAYPQFSCSGGPIEVVNDWGVFKEIYCAGNDSTFTFIEDILTEVMEIFPSEYIHIGGDEAPKFRWEHCEKCQQRIADERLTDEHGLQSYFIQRIEKFLNANGRKLIGWDEILEGGLSENASVQSWRGMDGGLTAAQQNHYAVMSPTSHCYLDYGLEAIDLKKIYSFNPIPENLAVELHKYILGGECNMWTEHVPDEATLDSKVFPRMIALAEVLWSGPDTGRYEDFYQRLQKHYPILDHFKIKYGIETLPLKIETNVADHAPYIILTKNQPDLELKYRWACADCDTNLTVYKNRLSFSQTGVLEVYAFKNTKPYGDVIKQELRAHLALFAAVSYTNPPHEWYPASGAFALTDGKLGSYNFRDGNWQGFWGRDVDVILDLGDERYISKITMNFLEYINAWILNPASFTVSVSDDQVTWKELGDLLVVPVSAEEKEGITVNPFILQFEEINTRYVRVQAENAGKLPAAHEAAGQDSWLFIDEIIVE